MSRLVGVPRTEINRRAVVPLPAIRDLEVIQSDPDILESVGVSFYDRNRSVILRLGMEAREMTVAMGPAESPCVGPFEQIQ